MAPAQWTPHPDEWGGVRAAPRRAPPLPAVSPKEDIDFFCSIFIRVALAQCMMAHLVATPAVKMDQVRIERCGASWETSPAVVDVEDTV